MSTLGKSWKRSTCNRGHNLEHNNVGKKRECRSCKKLRNQKHKLKKNGIEITLAELAKTFDFYAY